MNEAYQRLIESNPRVSTPTRRALLERSRKDDAHYVPCALNPMAFSVLRTLMDCVVPQASPTIELAARIDLQLAQGAGDGWRNARLPSDVVAYQAALDTLEIWCHREFGSGFSVLSPVSREDVLLRMFGGAAPNLKAILGSDRLLDPLQLQAWFEDVRADAVRFYMAHPETLSRIGYSGIANGGDGEPKSGFVRVGVDEREDWEPLAERDSVP